MNKLKEKYSVSAFPFEKQYRHDTLFPQPIRCLIIGASGSGKTTLLWNLITKDWLSFKHLYIFAKSIEQPIYQTLQKIYENIETTEGEKVAHFYNNCEEIISVDDCSPNSLIVFDDCILENQVTIKSYYTRGRPKNISCIYLSQCYTLIDLKAIRNNLNFICIFKQNNHYTNKVYNDFVGSDMPFSKFQEICNLCWKEDFGFLSIDLTKRIFKEKYRNKFQNIDEYE